MFDYRTAILAVIAIAAVIFCYALVFCFFICVALYSVGPDHD